jgi:hypothetical protein
MVGWSRGIRKYREEKDDANLQPSIPAKCFKKLHGCSYNATARKRENRLG